MKPKINVGYGTGNPAGFPDFKPINPWGRVPKIEYQVREPLYQICVKERATGKTIPIGPKGGADFLGPMLQAITAGIALGTEHEWEHPHLVAATT